MITEKTCKTCKIEKPAIEYYKNTRIKDGFNSKCKLCYEYERKNYKLKLDPNRINILKEKQCITCNLIKLTNEFYINRDSLDGFSFKCKICYNICGKESDRKRREPAKTKKKLAKELEDKLVGDGKRCSGCKEIKSKDQFCIKRNQKDGLNYYCKLCNLKVSRITWKNTRDRNKDNLDFSGTKKCKLCLVEKPKNEFNLALTNADGFDRYCKICKKIRKKAYVEKCEIKVATSVIDPNTLKKCNGCNIDLPITEFHMCKASPDGRQPRCSKCQYDPFAVSTNARARNARVKKYKPIPKEEIKTLLESHNYKCFYCGIEVKVGINLHLDHKMPIIRGGPHTIENLAPSCATCNLKKHRMTDVEYKEYLERKKLLMENRNSDAT